MKKILTLVIDGIGISDKMDGNALKEAKMPNFNNLLEKYPSVLLDAAGPNVGMPEGQPGNEKVGYKTLASGQVLKQKSYFVHDFVEEDSLATSGMIKDMLSHVKKHKSTIHVIGLMSDGGINSNISDTISILKFLKKQDVKVAVDFISDGKDVETKSVLKYIEMIESLDVPIVSLCGRYYAMNEDGKWDRTKIYYDLIRNGVGLKVKELRLALKNCYIRDITDEFIPPILVKPDANIKDNDAVLWVNYKSESSLQILTALTNPRKVTEFQTRPLINTKFSIMYPVSPDVDATVLINEENDESNGLGIYLSKLGMTQARIAEESAYDCVTYYFNGEENQKLPKCNNYLVAPPKVDTDKTVELGCAAVTKQIIRCMEKDTDFILASLDEADETAHTGDFKRTVEVLEFVDECIGKILESAELNFYTVFLLSTHGNAEEMTSEDGKASTTNTANKIPFTITDTKLKLINGSLANIAPTILDYMDISVPENMKASKSLIKE